MFDVKKLKPKDRLKLIRLHPLEGGREVKFLGQTFLGVSPDVFMWFNYLDLTELYKKE